LPARSAKAAKEIKSLINANVERVEYDSNLVARRADLTEYGSCWIYDNKIGI
jgi:methyl-accepting chemotaxis protein